MKVAKHLEDERTEERKEARDVEPAFLEMQRMPMGSHANLFSVVVGTLCAPKGDDQAPSVVYPGQQGALPLIARTAIQLVDAQMGQQVVLAFEGGDPAKPIIIGVLEDKGSLQVEASPGTLAVEVDGKRLLIDAQEQIVLRCGRASITLTKAGKVLIQGEYVSTRSSGVNRIKGGSVQIN